MDAFNLINSKLLLAKLCLFVLVPLLLHGIWKLLAYVAALCVTSTSVCRLLRFRGREDRV